MMFSNVICIEIFTRRNRSGNRLDFFFSDCNYRWLVPNSVTCFVWWTELRVQKQNKNNVDVVLVGCCASFTPPYFFDPAPPAPPPDCGREEQSPSIDSIRTPPVRYSFSTPTYQTNLPQQWTSSSPPFSSLLSPSTAPQPSPARAHPLPQEHNKLLLPPLDLLLNSHPPALPSTWRSIPTPSRETRMIREMPRWPRTVDR